MMSKKLLSYINNRYFIHILYGIYNIYNFFTYYNDMIDKINFITKLYYANHKIIEYYINCYVTLKKIKCSIT